eukprot:gene15348-22684_t
MRGGEDAAKGGRSRPQRFGYAFCASVFAVLSAGS